MKPLKIYAALARTGCCIALIGSVVFSGWACWHFVTFSCLVGFACACKYCPFIAAWWVWPIIIVSVCVHISWTHYAVRRMREGDSDLLLAEWIAFSPAVVCCFCTPSLAVWIGFAKKFPGVILAIACAIMSSLMFFPCENPISMLMLLGKRTRIWFKSHRTKRSAKRVLLFTTGTVIVRGVFLAVAWLMFIGFFSHGISGCASDIRQEILTEAIECESAIGSDASKEALENQDLIRRWIDGDADRQEKESLKALLTDLHVRHPRSGYDLCLAELIHEMTPGNEVVLAECRKLYLDMSNGSVYGNVRGLAMYRIGTLSYGSESIQWYLKAIECGGLGKEFSVKELHDIAIFPWKIDFSRCRISAVTIQDQRHDLKDSNNKWTGKR